MQLLTPKELLRTIASAKHIYSEGIVLQYLEHSEKWIVSALNKVAFGPTKGGHQVEQTKGILWFAHETLEQHRESPRKCES